MNCCGFSDISNLLHFFPSPGVATESHSQLTLFWVSALEDFCCLVFLVQEVRLEFPIVGFFTTASFSTSISSWEPESCCSWRWKSRHTWEVSRMALEWLVGWDCFKQCFSLPKSLIALIVSWFLILMCIYVCGWTCLGAAWAWAQEDT